MSFGDPNNPYGQPQQGQQPGYGYPQQPPAYPAQDGGYGYGMPTAPATMPGGVKAARVLLFIQGAFQILGAIIVAFGAAAISVVKDDPSLKAEDAEMLSSLGAGVLYVLAVISLAFAVFAIVAAAKFNSGRNGVRVATIVYAGISIVLGVFQLPLGIVSLVMSILILVFVAKADGKAWFNRPSY
ncbi:hypothetical protein ACN20G_08855 [Streptomyces sp. BI20]|uniref:hypothetical protein n=1 Tax=Streptomyces sp. BI20 TaxID=3403460 RepID=UPI003C73F8B6